MLAIAIFIKKYKKEASADMKDKIKEACVCVNLLSS